MLRNYVVYYIAYIPASQTGNKLTSAVRETGVSRHIGGPIKAPLNSSIR